MDPDNLPFSKSEGAVKGMYVELADLVGKKMDVEIDYVWWLTFYQRRAMRNTVLKNECDVVFAVPASKSWKAKSLEKTQAFMDFSFVLVSAPDLQVTSLEDLKDKRLGVQFQTNPHILMSMQDGYAFETLRTPEELFAALEKGSIDAAMLWGPLAGYDNKTLYGSKWKLTPLSGADMQGAVAVAVRTDKVGLKDRIDKALSALKPEIANLKTKYAVPGGPAIDLDHLTVTATPAAPASKPAARVVQPVTQTPAQQEAKEPVKEAAAAGSSAPEAEMAQVGRVRFNDACSHCHATDGASAIRVRDLRRLTSRYGADWVETARITIVNGLPDYGMPTWGEILTVGQIDELIAFIKTIQNK